MQGAGYPCDEGARSQIRKSEVTKKLAIAGIHSQDRGAEKRRIHIIRWMLEQEWASPAQAEAVEEIDPQVEKLSEAERWARINE